MPKYIASKKTKYADIAKHANVSVATVSRVMNHRELVSEDTVRQVYDAMRSLGCGPGRITGIGSRTRCVTVMVPFIGDSFYTEIIAGMKEAARYFGYRLIITNDAITDATIDEQIKTMEQENSTGYLLMSVISKDALEKLTNFMPVVQCCEYNIEPNISYVAIDNKKSAREMTDYLIQSGRRDIVFLNVNNDYSICSRLRFEGFCEAMSAAGLPVIQDRVIQLPSFDYRLALSELTRLLQSTESMPDCIFCTSDTFAAAAVKACIKNGLSVPNDIFVVGFDDIELSTMLTPSITTVRQPAFEIGYTGFKYLVELIEHPDTPVRKTLLDGQMIIRESTMLHR